MLWGGGTTAGEAGVGGCVWVGRGLRQVEGARMGCMGERRVAKSTDEAWGEVRA